MAVETNKEEEESFSQRRSVLYAGYIPILLGIVIFIAIVQGYVSSSAPVYISATFPNQPNFSPSEIGAKTIVYNPCVYPLIPFQSTLNLTLVGCSLDTSIPCCPAFYTNFNDSFCISTQFSCNSPKKCFEDLYSTTSEVENTSSLFRLFPTSAPLLSYTSFYISYALLIIIEIFVYLRVRKERNERKKSPLETPRYNCQEASVKEIFIYIFTGRREFKVVDGSSKLAICSLVVCIPLFLILIGLTLTIFIPRSTNIPNINLADRISNENIDGCFSDRDNYFASLVGYSYGPFYLSFFLMFFVFMNVLMFFLVLAPARNCYSSDLSYVSI